MLALALNPTTGNDMMVVYDNKTMVHYRSTEFIKSYSVPDGAYITSLGWKPQINKMVKTENFIAASSDGRIYILKLADYSLVTEKKMKAHDGSVIQIKWSSDGLSFASSGEDGEVKIWSKVGNLRTRLGSFDKPVYDFAWGPDNESIVLGIGNVISIIHSQGHEKKRSWKAYTSDDESDAHTSHSAQSSSSGVILAIDWNCINQLIVCGGENRCYKIFNSVGVPLYTSSLVYHQITSLAWAPSGKFFIVGSFNFIGLYGINGISHSLKYLECGSLLNTVWSPDGSSIATMCGDGTVSIMNIIGNKEEWGSTTCQHVREKEILISDASVTSDDCVGEIVSTR